MVERATAAAAHLRPVLWVPPCLQLKGMPVACLSLAQMQMAAAVVQVPLVVLHLLELVAREEMVLRRQ